MHLALARPILLCGLFAAPCTVPPRARRVACIETNDAASSLRQAVKKGLLSALDVAEGGLAEWKEEKEEERVLDLIAEAERTRAAAQETRMRKSLPQGFDDDDEYCMAGAPCELEPSRFDWVEAVPDAMAREEDKRQKAEKREARRARTRAIGTELSERAKGAAFTAATAAAEAAVAATEAFPARLPGDGVSAEQREGIARRIGRTAGVAAKRAARWARLRRNVAQELADLEAQTQLLAEHKAELELLGLTDEAEAQAAAGKRMTERQLRMAFRVRSRELHPDVSALGDEDAAAMYEMNRAYEQLRKVIRQ